MPGTSKTDAFMLGAATVMIGAPDKLFDMTPTLNGVGLTKNFTITAEPAYTDLTQGVKNSIVYSVLTGNPVRATMEVYEYTARNLMYALGLDGSAVAKKTVSGIVGTLVTGDDIVKAVTLGTGEGTGFTVGDTVMISNDDDDSVFIRKLASKSTDTLTFDYEFATGQNVLAGATVKVVNVADIGSKDNQPFFSAKVVGTLANGEQVALLIPKIRITRGFSMAFQSDNFSNLPFEFQIFDLVTTDPFYTYFSGAQAKLFRQ